MDNGDAKASSPPKRKKGAARAKDRDIGTISPVDGSELIRNRLPASGDTPDLGTKGNQEGDRVRSIKRSRTIARQDRVRGSSVRGREITAECTGKLKRPR